MFEIDEVIDVLSATIPVGTNFQPTNLETATYFPEEASREDDEGAFLDPEFDNGRTASPALSPLIPKYPYSKEVVAIDSTSFTLGHIPEGVVISVRLSVIIKPPNSNSHRLERYGPYLCPITHQNKDVVYSSLFKAVYGRDPGGSAPLLAKVIDRVRNLLERHIQLKVATNFENSLLLFDGSLIGETIANPRFYLERILGEAVRNNNIVVAISKSTALTLQKSSRSILSLLEGIQGPCSTADIRDIISQNRSRYLGGIYVGKLTPMGDAFRLDVPENSPTNYKEILGMVSGLAGDYGYPEELKLAHLTCVLSYIEIMEMQACATKLYGLEIIQNLRQKLFPM